jgi:hypothetical protein
MISAGSREEEHKSRDGPEGKQAGGLQQESLAT